MTVFGFSGLWIESVCRKYDELCRRFLADSEDFALEKVMGAGVCRSFINIHLEKCLKEIHDYIRGQIDGD